MEGIAEIIFITELKKVKDQAIHVSGEKCEILSLEVNVYGHMQ